MKKISISVVVLLIVSLFSMAIAQAQVSSTAPIRGRLLKEQPKYLTSFTTFAPIVGTDVNAAAREALGTMLLLFAKFKCSYDSNNMILKKFPSVNLFGITATGVQCIEYPRTSFEGWATTDKKVNQSCAEINCNVVYHDPKVGDFIGTWLAD